MTSSPDPDTLVKNLLDEEGHASSPAAASTRPPAPAPARARVAADGSVLPAKAPKRKQDGLFQRPAGRTRKGMAWDATRGIWIPDESSSGKSSAVAAGAAGAAKGLAQSIAAATSAIDNSEILDHFMALVRLQMTQHWANNPHMLCHAICQMLHTAFPFMPIRAQAIQYVTQQVQGENPMLARAVNTYMPPPLMPVAGQQMTTGMMPVPFVTAGADATAAGTKRGAGRPKGAKNKKQKGAAASPAGPKTRTSTGGGGTPGGGSSILLSEEPLEGNSPLGEPWPKGWRRRFVKRTGGRTTGRVDQYWLTPVLKKMLRSMSEVRQFLTFLKEQNDENAAWNRLKASQSASKKIKRESTESGGATPAKKAEGGGKSTSPTRKKALPKAAVDL